MKLHIIPFTLVLLASCSPNPRDDLERSLVGKPPEQRRAILADACGKELAKIASLPGNAEDAEVFKRICEERTGREVSIGPR